MLEFLLALLTTATVGVLLIPLLRARTESTGRLDGEGWEGEEQQEHDAQRP